MYPTLVFGVIALALAVRHAVRPAPHVMPLLIGLGLSTLFSGMLGMVTGFIATFKYVEALPPERQPPIVLIGLGESMANVVLALIFATLIALVAGIGSFRARLPVGSGGGSAVPTPG